MTITDVRQSQYTIDECLCGQRYDGMYDPLRQIAMRPELRKGTIYTYDSSSIEGLFAQIQSIFGQEKRTVKTREYWTTENTTEGGISVVVLKQPTIPSAGANVTVTIDPQSHSMSGSGSLPSAGYMVYLNGTPTKKYLIASVNKSTAGAHTLTLTPLNGEVADFSQKDRYTLLVSRMKVVGKCASGCLTGENFVTAPPTLRKHYVQKYEKTYCLQEDELDNYAYTQLAEEITFTDSYGKVWKQWYDPQYTSALMNDLRTNRILETLFGVRDNVNETGFDGVITTAEKNSFLNQVYDPAQGASFYQIFMNMVRRIRNIRGCTNYLLAHDFNFGITWNQGIMELVKNSTGSNNYSFFGPGGQGMRDLEWCQFGNFHLNGYNFSRYQMDIFDDPKFGGDLRKDFALMLPMTKFKDTMGNEVPIVTYNTIEGAEKGPDMQIYTVDKRKTMNCRQVDYVAKDIFGVEIHGANQLAVMYKQTC